MREDPVPFSPCDCPSWWAAAIQSLPPAAILLFSTKLTIWILEHKSWLRMALYLARSSVS